MRIAVVVAILVAAGRAEAYMPKPSVAILGIEVVGALDGETTRVAEALTSELRARPRGGASGYVLEQRTNALDLADVKLLHGCAGAEPACMVVAGKHVTLLVYGTLERTPDGFMLALQALSVAEKKVTASWTEVVPLDIDDAKLAEVARRAYRQLARVDDRGSLVLRTPAEQGTVVIGGERHALTNGGATVRLEQGVHAIAIEAPGYERWTSHVMVHDNETAELGIDLVPVSQVPAVGGRRGCAGCAASHDAGWLALALTVCGVCGRSGRRRVRGATRDALGSMKGAGEEVVTAEPRNAAACTTASFAVHGGGSGAPRGHGLVRLQPPVAAQPATE